ncbi:hypothetical protein LTR15_007445 [Elasticomyces elasticus]|nr:hypothetical protein LTR15_007445 [Elasticomyces elasticus]
MTLEARSMGRVPEVPISWPPSEYWDGNDGLWNTFTISVGTPPQSFRILPSTFTHETWVPNPQGCTNTSPTNCAYLRGVLPFDGVNSPGFNHNESGTWNMTAGGLYSIPGGSETNATAVAVLGQDTVYLNGTTDVALVNQTGQVVAGLVDLTYWLGLFGLSPQRSNFTDSNIETPNFMRGLVTGRKIPSLSWGYTAGAYYRNQAPASLTLGGYDMNRIDTSNLTFDMQGDSEFQVAVLSIAGENTLGGADLELFSDATLLSIDSTEPFISLPDDACQAFVNNFGLTYDNNTDLFLINDSMRQTMLSNNPTITFKLGLNTSSSNTEVLNITLPYAAFDLQASYPLYQNATNYFPIRRVVGYYPTYTMGRTFLQEAYLVADYERNLFTVAQATFTNMDQQHLVPIQAVPTASSTRQPSPGVSSGAIAGIVVAVVIGVTAASLGVWLCICRNKHKTLSTKNAGRSEEDVVSDKIDATRLSRSELPSENALAEAPAGEKRPSELASLPLASEMEGDMGKARGRSGMFEMPAGAQGSGTLVEAPGGEVYRQET